MAKPLAIVSVSGGKDSTATAIVAIDTYGPDRVVLVHADVGAHEHELTRAYVREDLPRALGLPVQIVKADFAQRIANKRRYVEEKWAAQPRRWLRAGTSCTSRTTSGRRPTANIRAIWRCAEAAGGNGESAGSSSLCAAKPE